jgi:hypothetical protein
MIERLLAADAALDRDDLDLAERLFSQVVEADERNAIAVGGLGRVAMGRGVRDEALLGWAHALGLDPVVAGARRLLDELEGVSDAGAPELGPEAESEPEAGPAMEAVLEAEPESSAAPEPAPAAAPAPEAARKRESLLARIRRWLGGGRRGS